MFRITCNPQESATVQFHQFIFGATKTCPNTGAVSRHTICATAHTAQQAREAITDAWHVEVDAEPQAVKPPHYFLCEVDCS